MSKVHLTKTKIQEAEIRESRYSIRDDTPGLILRVGASGSKVFYVDYYDTKGKRCLHKLGSADILTIAQAREATREYLARVMLGEDTKKKRDSGTLGEFLESEYFPWVLASRKSGQATIKMLRSIFAFLWKDRIQDIDVMRVDRWRVERLREIKAASINREMTALKSALNWGVKRELLDAHPLAKLERLQERDSQTKVRYLSPNEHARLMAALDAREEKLRQGRTNHNKWLKERGQPLMPAFADHIRPMVIISLCTGIRRGSLFSLVWDDVNFETRIMTLRPEGMKGGKACYIPLNETAFKAFFDWRKLSTGEGLVFPSPISGKRLDNVNKAWASLMKLAKIENFRWHDMRHDFASRLVMKGIDLNTVRELLGHSDMKMTLRYAHLAPEAKAKAVAVLD